MRSIILTATRLLPVALFGAMLASCDDSGTTPPPGSGDTLATPSTYTFDSRFTTGTSSIAYNGQVVRSLLIQDLKTVIDNLGKPGATAITMNDLLKYYDHSDADNMMTITPTGTLQPLETKYATLGPNVKLVNKISPAQVIGTGKTADQLLREWFQIIADNSQDPTKLGTPNVYIDQGRNLSQLINKVLHGSVAYYQGTGVYLQGLLDKDNSKGVDKTGGGTEPYTAMEHSWDEAFGYWGAARDYARYTDAQLAGATADYVYDSNGDGKIDLKTEYNYTFARNAGKRDKSATGLDLTKETFDAFLKGRTTIVNKGTVDALTAYRTMVANNWEKNIAATVIHYINQVRTNTSALTNESTATNSPTLSNVWGEMKGFAIALQYNPFKMISEAQLTQLHELLGSAPVIAPGGSTANTEYMTKLENARNILKTVYGFSEANVTSF